MKYVAAEVHPKYTTLNKKHTYQEFAAIAHLPYGQIHTETL